MSENISENTVEAAAEPVRDLETENSFSFKDIKVGNVIEFIDPALNKKVQGVVRNRAGKATSKLKYWWNVENIETGEPASFETDKLESLKKVADQEHIEENVENVFLVTLPRWQHNEPRCKAAKEKELQSWEDFGTYVEVKDEGQDTLGLNWVLVEKIIDGKLGVKARLCVRGDQERGNDVRTDSPTIHKINVKLFFLIAAMKNWKVKTSDVKCAFLQGSDLDRDVFVRPPKEKRINGVIWKMVKRAYGFTDASRGFYIELSETLIRLGCKQSKLDEALYLWYDKDGEVAGMLLTHVDDILHGTGTEEFEKRILQHLKEKFQFGSEEEGEFRYVGMQVKQGLDGILVDQNHYLDTVEIPETDHDKPDDELLGEDGQSDFRGIVGKIGWLGGVSRPDLAYDHVVLSTRLGKATVADVKQAIKVIKKLKVEQVQMMFPDLGNIKEWTISGYGDAGFRSLPDKTSSCGGQVVVIKNRETGAACVVSWRSRKLKRIVNSSTGAEALAFNDTVSELVYIKAVLKEMLGDEMIAVPLEVYTDSKNLLQASKTTSLVEDHRLRIEVAVLKESLEEGELEKIEAVSGKQMIADCLTKRGASAKLLLDIVKKGKMTT